MLCRKFPYSERSKGLSGENRDSEKEVCRNEMNPRATELCDVALGKEKRRE